MKHSSFREGKLISEGEREEGKKEEALLVKTILLVPMSNVPLEKNSEQFFSNGTNS